MWPLQVVYVGERMCSPMRSILIRYTDSKYADSHITGNLCLSSLSKFWNLEEVNSTATMQQDFSEGVATQVPRDVLNKDFMESFAGHIIHDARFRIEAYGYCNLLCFYRIDAIDTTEAVTIDTSYNSMVQINPVLNNRMNHVIQIPDSNMESFGDTVVIVKDEEKFVKRVLAAVKKAGGECITGDIRYHPLKDRLNSSTMNNHHITMISGKGASSDGLFDFEMFCSGRNDVIRYGSLDKYNIYARQKEWRVCWLPDEKNNEPKTLHVGDMSDIVEIIPAKKLMSRLQRFFPGYLFGHVNETRTRCIGTLRYNEFKRKVESIDGKCRVIFDIG